MFCYGNARFITSVNLENFPIMVVSCKGKVERSVILFLKATRAASHSEIGVTFIESLEDRSRASIGSAPGFYLFKLYRKFM